MRFTVNRPRARLLRSALFALAIVATTASVTAAIVLVTPDNGPFTGCLASKSNKSMSTTKGVFYNVAKGATPLANCLAGDTVVSVSNAQGAKGDPGERGPAGTSAGIVRVRWDFDFAARALPRDTFSQTQLEHGSIVTGLSASLTLSDIPAGCASVDVWLDPFYSGGGALAQWLSINTTGDITDIAPDQLHTKVVSDNAHPLTGILGIDTFCFDAAHLRMDPDITPAVTGNVVFEWNHAPVVIP